jgi:dienelactone hydrolase
MTQPSTHSIAPTVVQIAAGRITLVGDLTIPDGAQAIVLFAHGSGSSRHSPRNRVVAEALHGGGLATLLLDLLTEYEEYQERFTGHLRFDIGLLAQRLVNATDWLAARPDTRALKVGYFGASTGGGAALAAAAERPEAVGAVVSRGGRPDLAGAEALAGVRAPTLLIVGGDDSPVIAMNQEALARLRCEKRLEIVPGATHLFEEPGALEEVARLAAHWFQENLVPARAMGTPLLSRSEGNSTSDSALPLSDIS